MEELRQILKRELNSELYQIIISNPRKKEGVFKIKIRPILYKGQLYFQESRYIGTQVMHKNYPEDLMAGQVVTAMEDFRQLEMSSTNSRVTVLISQKGKITVKYKKHSEEQNVAETELLHNRKKRYLLEEGIPVSFLVDLGIQTAEGKIVQAKYDKFRQINRYLEFVEDILPRLPQDRTLEILDFGCGKAYLTFAMYYYLCVLKKRKVRMTGLDLKKDVVIHCSTLADRYGYDGLRFLQGDIENYEPENGIDMVVTLHACDTATDYAMEKAVRWGAEVIFLVPCCQHELNRQIQSDLFEPVLKYGIIRERMSALITDAIRANVLEEQGYQTQILEFIDMEHTPKNLLIRAVKKQNGKTGKKQTGDLLKSLHLEPLITKLL